MGKECIRRIAALADPTATILVTHLFTEHWLNQILQKFCPHEDLTDFNYSRKLRVAYGIGRIPMKLYENLKKLNKLRNNMAHQLDFDFTTMDLGYHPTNPDFALTGFKPSYDPNAKQHHVMNVTKCVFADTYMWLHGHCVKELGFTKEAVHRRTTE